jgi:hypothetical protein
MLKEVGLLDDNLQILPIYLSPEVTHMLTTAGNDEQSLFPTIR